MVWLTIMYDVSLVTIFFFLTVLRSKKGGQYDFTYSSIICLSHVYDQLDLRSIRSIATINFFRCLAILACKLWSFTIYVLVFILISLYIYIYSEGADRKLSTFCPSIFYIIITFFNGTKNVLQVFFFCQPTIN